MDVPGRLARETRHPQKSPIILPRKQVHYPLLGDSMHHGWPSTNSTPANARFFFACRVRQSGQCGCPAQAWAALAWTRPVTVLVSSSFARKPGTLGLLVSLHRRERARKKKKSVEKPIHSGLCRSSVHGNDADGPQRKEEQRHATRRCHWDGYCSGASRRRACSFTIYQGLQYQYCEHAVLCKSLSIGTNRH